MKVQILIPNIFNHPFTYDSDLDLKVGDYVMVPFGKSEVTGVVWDDFEAKKPFKLLDANFCFKVHSEVSFKSEDLELKDKEKAYEYLNDLFQKDMLLL